ncbi:MAG: DUF72 domain-containing protein, partial [Pyrinomonadaceae bacterium]
GTLENPVDVDFALPPDAAGTAKALASRNGKGLKIYVGCSKWGKNELQGFYPRGVKNELAYYSTQFNSIELNALAYGRKPKEVIKGWYESTPTDFRFFSKFSQSISHYRRLNNTEEFVENFVSSLSELHEKLGGLFLQMNANFAPKDIDRVFRFVEFWRWEIPLFVEFRHTDWYREPAIASQIYTLFEEAEVSTVITDTAARRDLLHMRLTTPRAFVRFVGNNHQTDFERLDAWVERIATWKQMGLDELAFFVHQNFEKKPALLATYFIEKLNKKIGATLNIPKLQG